MVIAVDVLKSSDDSWQYSFDLAVLQNVALLRNPSLVVLGVDTWSVGGFGRISKINVRNLRDHIKDDVDKFINAYLAVNPKK